MTAMLLVALGAAVGAPLRYLASTRLDGGWPIGTLLVNLVGSGLLGAFAGWSLDGALWALLGTGFCGGLTTYSSFAVQTHNLGWRRGVGYVILTLAGSFATCWLGFLVAVHT